MGDHATLQLDYRDNCLVIHVHGRAILDQTEKTMQRIATAITARPVRATLVDVRAVPGRIAFLDRFQLGKMAGQYLAGMRVGCLMHEAQADPQRIGQLAARNRGANVEIFTDPAAAEAWLKKQSAPKPGPG
jgi:hypothetical protein